MKQMAHLATTMHRVLGISLAFDHSLIGSVLSSGQETSSSTWRVAHGDEDVMANYLPVVINQSTN
jgi:hypothetical protein